MNEMKTKMEKKKCFFCQIIKEKEKYIAEKIIYLIAENKKSIAILDKFPISDGHILLITKEHFSNISEVSDIES
jgi:diadenosine tetraphosphate (Ap4A) HIT family hydrolase